MTSRQTHSAAGILDDEERRNTGNVSFGHASNAATMDDTDIFVSYGRGDDEPFTGRLYDDLTSRGFRLWSDRRAMPSRGLTFTQEIRDAIDRANRLLLIVGTVRHSVAIRALGMESRSAVLEERRSRIAARHP